MFFSTDTFITPILEILASLSWVMEFSMETAAFVLLLCFFGLAGLENRHPAVKNPIRQVKRSFHTNLSLFVFNNILMSISSIASLYWIADHVASSGLLAHIANPGARGLLAFLAMDLLLYGWHVVCHKSDALWQLHRVHHNDPYLNVSTAFRLHIVEMLLSHSLKAALIILLGVDKALVLMIEAVTTLSIMFHHANIALPFERQLGRFMIVPYLHRVHHSAERAEHDSNYGAVFSVWDQIFGSLLELEPKAIGIKGESPQDWFGLFKFGFGNPAPAPAHPAELETMIAVAAYYRAEKRDFLPGDDQRDWHEAKAEVIARYYAEKYQPIPETSIARQWFQRHWAYFNRRCKQKIHLRFG